MIYILGGNGFVGSGFVRLFEKLKLEYRIIDRENYKELSDSFCDVLINANGNSSKLLAKREPMTDFDANVRATKASLEDFKYNFYIHLSSCDVYPNCTSPITTLEDSIIDPHLQSPYGFHKLLAEQCVQHRCDKWLILRQGGFVGPGMKKNAVFDILSAGKLWLDPESELQFLHTDDSAAIIWSLYTNGLTNEIINICGQGLIKLREILQWSGKNVETAPNSPAVHYEVNITKLTGYESVPATINTVRSFVLAN